MTARPLDFLAGLLGADIDGGCDRCDAYQRVTRHETGTWILTVHHDPTCPVLARHEGRLQ